MQCEDMNDGATDVWKRHLSAQDLFLDSTHLQKRQSVFSRKSLLAQEAEENYNNSLRWQSTFTHQNTAWQAPLHLVDY